MSKNETTSLNNWINGRKDMRVSNNLSKISRRDLFRVAGRYGLSSTLLAAGGFAARSLSMLRLRTMAAIHVSGATPAAG